MINADPGEVAKFEALAEQWWDPDGDFKPLHDINGPRVEYIRSRCAVAGRRVLDVGCGGGLLTEALADLGAKVTGLDAGEAPLAVARAHAAARGRAEAIDYVAGTAESFLAAGGTAGEADGQPAAAGAFDVVTCMETLEHVPDAASAVSALAALTAPGGDVFLATINRTAKAFALAIVGAEHLLRILPKGTHRYADLIRPAELARACRNAGLEVVDIVGVAYNPFTRRCRLVRDVGVNYMLHARRPPEAGAQS